MDDDLARRLHTWVSGYVQAWNSNDPAAIGALFTQDAAYYTEPYSPPWQGRDEIVRRWLDRKDKPGETEFRWHPLAVREEIAVVQGETIYRTPPQTYSNLWVIRLDAEGRCTEFTEWWMKHPDSESSTPRRTLRRSKPFEPPQRHLNAKALIAIGASTSLLASIDNSWLVAVTKTFRSERPWRSPWSRRSA